MLRFCFLYPLWFYYITSNLPLCVCINNELQQNVEIDLSTYNKTNKDTHIFINYLNLNEGNAIVTIKNPPNNNGFFVIQVHGLLSNISLSKTLNLKPNTFVIGTNVGLVETNLQSSKSYLYYINYINNPINQLLLSIIVYEQNDPVPGGCNMVFKNEIAPYQMVTYTDNIIVVDAQPASINNYYCESNVTPHLDMYHMYLDEGILDSDAYFIGIRKFLTVDDIKLNGRKVAEPLGHTNLRRYYSAYLGTGSIFGVIARYKNLSSAYVPIATYACDINNWNADCTGPVTVGWKILCAIQLFVGVFTCYFGHIFFKTQMFICGFIFGGFVTYVAMSINSTATLEQILGITILFGIIYGGIWIVLWWRFGSPIISVLLPVSFIGYMLSCIIFYSGIGDFQLYQSDANYWLTLFSILISTTVLLLIPTMFANILACSMLGATGIIIAIDHYAGGNLHYVIVNNVRRATVRNFNLAVLDPPFQYRDIILSVAWVFLTLTGVLAQFRQQRGRPPFPPPPIRPRIMNMISEVTPLLSGTRSSGVPEPENSRRASNNIVSSRTPLC